MKKILFIIGIVLVIEIIFSSCSKFSSVDNMEYLYRLKVVESSNRIKTFVDDTEEGLDIYYLIKQDNGEDLRVDNVYYYDIVAPDYESENYIRFTDETGELVGLYNDKGEIAIPPVYSGLTRVHNGMLYALLGGVKDNIGYNGDRHDVLVGGTTILLNTKGEVLIRDMAEPNELLDMFSLKVTTEPQKVSLYRSFKGTNGKYYNFVHLESYFEDFITSEFLPSTVDGSWVNYLTDHVMTDIEIKNENIGDHWRYDKSEMLTSQKSLVTKAFSLASSSDPNLSELVYDVNDWMTTVDEEVVSEKDKKIYMNEKGMWHIEEFPLFELTIKEKQGTLTRSNHYKFYRNKNGHLILYKIIIRTNYF